MRALGALTYCSPCPDECQEACTRDPAPRAGNTLERHSQALWPELA